MIFGLRWYGPAGLLMFLIATAGMLLQIDPFYWQYYQFAWYGYIFLIDSIVHRLRGRSLINDRFGEFLFMLTVSFGVWMMFEGFNLWRLDNWYYGRIVEGRVVPLPPKPANYPLYFTAYATVLPGEFLTLALVRVWAERKRNWLHRVPMRTWRMTHVRFAVFQAAGWACLVLSLVWPKAFFPLMWLWGFFIFDSINCLRGRPSIVRQMSQGSAALLVQLLLAGMICGALWEFWNYRAGAKWIYTVPHPFDKLKIFEMPILGYFGFPPFALECYALYHFIRSLPGVRRLAPGRSFAAFEEQAAGSR